MRLLVSWQLLLLVLAVALASLGQFAYISVCYKTAIKAVRLVHSLLL